VPRDYFCLILQNTGVAYQWAPRPMGSENDHTGHPCGGRSTTPVFTSELVIVTMIVQRQFSKILMLREPLHSFQLPFVGGVSRLDYVIISFFD